MVNIFLWYFCVIKDNIFVKVTKIHFPNRDGILYSFGIASNITYLTKHLNSDNSRICDI